MATFDLTGRTALITGAGGGLGRVFSLALARQGARVLCADIDGDAAQETKGMVVDERGQAEALTVDVADAGAVDDMVRAVSATMQALHVLVNNAGVASVPTRLLDVSVAEWDRVVAVNLRGPFLCTRALLPLLLAAKSASVINLSSYLGLVGAYPGYPVTAIQYGTTKAGIIGFTRQLAMEYALDGIRVNAIAPGWHFGTNLGRARSERSTPDENARFLSYAKSTIPLGRFGSPEDLCGLITYLASDASSYLTGQVFAHDGGITAG